MKKYLFLFLIPFLFFGSKVYASEIRLFTSDYSLVDSCQSNMCVFNNPSGASKRIRFIPDTLTAEANTSYTNKFNFQVLSSYNDLNISTCDWFINNQSFSYTSQTFSRLSNVYFSTNIWQSDFTFQNTRTFASTQTYSSFLECEMNQSSVIRRVSFNHILSVNSSGSNEDIINSNNANTTNIINNNNNNTENIINNQNQNTENIINNQNQNTQDLIDSNLVCNYYNSSTINIDNSFINADGDVLSTSNTNFGVVNNIIIDSSSIITVTKPRSGSGAFYCFYNSNHVKITCSNTSTNSIGDIISIPTTAKYFSFTVLKSDNIPNFSVCKNGNQSLNDSILDDSHASPNDWLRDMDDLRISNTPITDLLTMPLTLIQAFQTGISGQCTAISLGTWLDTPISIPCIDLESLLGSNLITIIDFMFFGFMFYNIAQLLIHDFDKLSSLEDLFDETYTPNHVYKPKHGGGN